jgi:hypothetical protein
MLILKDLLGKIHRSQTAFGQVAADRRLSPLAFLFINMHKHIAWVRQLPSFPLLMHI